MEGYNMRKQIKLKRNTMYSLKELEQIMSLNQVTLKRWRKKGLEAYVVGRRVRITREQLKAFLTRTDIAIMDEYEFI